MKRLMKPRLDVIDAIRSALERGFQTRAALVTDLRLRNVLRGSPPTVARHVRRAIGWMQVLMVRVHGYSVGTTGRGFRLLRSGSDEREAADLLIQQAAWLMLRAARLSGSIEWAKTKLAKRLHEADSLARKVQEELDSALRET